MASLRSTLARLKKLLLAREIELVEQGVELAVSLDDAETVEALLEGVEFDADARKGRQGTENWGGLVPNGIFSGTRPAQPFHDVALVLLVASAPGERAASLRKKMKSLGFGPASAWGIEMPHLPIAPLCKLTALERLTIGAPGEARGIGALGALENLEKLVVRAQSVQDFAGLGRAPKLRELDISGDVTGELDLRGAKALRSVDIHGRVERLTGLADTPIETLVVRGALGSVDGVARMPSLTRLGLIDTGVSDLSGLAGAKALVRLHLMKASGTLAHLPALEELILDRANVQAEPEAVPRLRHVTAERVSAIGWLRRLPALESLNVEHVELKSFGELAGAEKLAKLFVRWCGELETLDDLARMPALRQLAIDGCRGLVRIDELPKIPWSDAKGAALSEVSLYGSAKLESIRAVGGIEGMIRLDLRSCTALTTLAGLEGAAKLRGIDLRQCSSLSDVSALAGCSDLRVIAAAGTPLDEMAFPEDVRWAVTFSKDAHVERMCDRPKPKATTAAAKAKKKRKTGLPDELYDTWEAITAAITTGHPKRLQEAVDLARTTGRAEIYDALLAKTTPGSGAVIPGAPFRRGDPSERLRAVLRLIGEAPANAAVAAKLREGLVKIDLAGAAGYRHKSNVDLGPLARLPNVTELCVRRATAIENAAALGQLPLLEEANIDTTLDELTAFGKAPKLRKLTVERVGSLRGAADLPALQELYVRYGDSDPTPLVGALGLRILHLRLADNADLRALGMLPALENLHLDSAGALRTLGVLGPLAALRRLYVSGATVADLSGAPSGVEFLRIDYAKSLASTRGLAADAKLTCLRIGSSSTLRDLEGLPRGLELLGFAHMPVPSLAPLRELPALRAVAFSYGQIDLSGLAGHPSLRVIDLASAPPCDLSPLASCPALEEVNLTSTSGFDPKPLAGHPSLKKVITRYTSLEAAYFPGVPIDKDARFAEAVPYW